MENLPQIVCNFKSKGILIRSNITTRPHFYKKKEGKEETTEH